MKQTRTEKYKEYRDNLKGNFEDNLEFHIKYIINDYLQEHKGGSFLTLKRIVVKELNQKFKEVKNEQNK